MKTLSLNIFLFCFTSMFLTLLNSAKANQCQYTTTEQKLDISRQKILDKYWKPISVKKSEKVRPAMKRFATYAAKMEGVLLSIKGQTEEEVALEIVNSGIRHFLMQSQEIARIYKKFPKTPKEQKAIREVHAQLKALEDAIGKYGEVQDFIRSIKEKYPEISKDALAEADSILHERKSNLIEVVFGRALVDVKMPSGRIHRVSSWNWNRREESSLEIGTVQSPPLRRERKIDAIDSLFRQLSQIDFKKSKKDRQFLRKAFIRHLERSLEKSLKELDLNQLQAGIHEFRRVIRRFLIIVESFQGAINFKDGLGDVKNPILQKMLSDPVIDHRYNNYHLSKEVENALLISRPLLLMTSKINLRISKIKDSEEYLEFFAEILSHLNKTTFEIEMVLLREKTGTRDYAETVAEVTELRRLLLIELDVYRKLISELSEQ